MATRKFYVTRDQKHPLYPTRMLTAGVPIPLSDSGAKLYRDMGIKDLTDEEPKKARVAAERPAPTPEPAAPQPTARKAPAKKAARRKKS